MIPELNDSILKEIGVDAYGYISTSEIIFDEEVRSLCEKNACGRYGATWVCPPGVGSLEECKARCLAYSRALVFSCVYQLEDSFDYEGLMEGNARFKEVCRKLGRRLCGDYLILSNEGCNNCASCTYPDAPCRFPDKAFHPVEAYGIFVNKLAQSAQIPYRNGKDTVTYFGMVCFNKKAE